jgi:hypothetical protein
MMKSWLLVVLVCTACEVPPEAKPPEAPPAPIVAQPAVDAGAAKQGDGVQLTVSEALGLDPAIVGQVYGQARESLGHCHQPGGGTVHVSVVKRGASLQMHIEPGATLDPLAHRCVLEALSTVELPDTAANGGGPAVPPSGFTSLITLTW